MMAYAMEHLSGSLKFGREYWDAGILRLRNLDAIEANKQKARQLRAANARIRKRLNYDAGVEPDFDATD